MIFGDVRRTGLNGIVVVTLRSGSVRLTVRLRGSNSLQSLSDTALISRARQVFASNSSDLMGDLVALNGQLPLLFDDRETVTH